MSHVLVAVVVEVEPGPRAAVGVGPRLVALRLREVDPIAVDLDVEGPVLVEFAVPLFVHVFALVFVFVGRPFLPVGLIGLGAFRLGALDVPVLGSCLGRFVPFLAGTEDVGTSREADGNYVGCRGE